MDFSRVCFPLDKQAYILVSDSSYSGRQVAEAYIGLMPDLSFEIYHKILFVNE